MKDDAEKGLFIDLLDLVAQGLVIAVLVGAELCILPAHEPVPAEAFVLTEALFMQHYRQYKSEFPLN